MPEDCIDHLQYSLVDVLQLPNVGAGDARVVKVVETSTSDEELPVLIKRIWMMRLDYVSEDEFRTLGIDLA